MAHAVPGVRIEFPSTASLQVNLGRRVDAGCRGWKVEGAGVSGAMGSRRLRASGRNRRGEAGRGRRGGSEGTAFPWQNLGVEWGEGGTGVSGGLSSSSSSKPSGGAPLGASSSGLQSLTAGDGALPLTHATPLPLLAWLDAFVRFTRPHTMLGTAISICSISLLAVQSVADVNAGFFVGILKALLPALAMNVYIVGLNQLTDIEIDKVNKPYLPLASGEFSIATGATIISVAAALSLAMGALVGSNPLTLTLVISMILGTAYSVDVPFLRWKRFPILAAGCILAVRAFIVQLGFFSHIQESVFNRPIQFTPSLVFATSFMCLFSVVIALFKDIPDVDGDRIYGIRSLSVRLGQQTVYWTCIGILLLAYGSALFVSAQSNILWSKVLSSVAHIGAACLLWFRAQTVDFEDPSSISRVYMFVWKLFYLEYLLLPLMR